MKTQRAREEQSVVIATALAVFVGCSVLCAAAVAVAASGAGGDVSRSLETAMPWSPAASALVAVAYLARHRR